MSKRPDEMTEQELRAAEAKIRAKLERLYPDPQPVPADADDKFVIAEVDEEFNEFPDFAKREMLQHVDMFIGQFMDVKGEHSGAGPMPDKQLRFLRRRLFEQSVSAACCGIRIANHRALEMRNIALEGVEEFMAQFQSQMTPDEDKH